jgi:hypothetical protein
MRPGVVVNCQLGKLIRMAETCDRLCDLDKCPFIQRLCTMKQRSCLYRLTGPVACIFFVATSVSLAAQSPAAPLFSVHEVELRATGSYTNPYLQLEADVVLTAPEGATRIAPLFWDGNARWKFRFSPDLPGEWSWTIRSRDSGLNGQTGGFRAIESDRPGSIRPMRGFPRHFERQNGSRFWFMGDTAWALYTDNQREKHDRHAAQGYLEARAKQGFNAVHSMLMSEAGWDNRGGAPFDAMAEETINPRYWQEVDHRVAEANGLGFVCGLAVAWGDKSDEPYAWRKFPSLEARKRYARYIAARYAAYDVYFIVSGEWHAEIRSRRASESTVRDEFIELGAVLQYNDPHRRMIAIHPMNGNGSAREFNEAPWMSFGDYQQNYYELHERLLQSLRFNKPVVNSEYAYYLRDQNGDGIPDKENSTTLDIMRAATWDIVMAGGYVVTGFGTTYFGGNRDPGPFDIDAEKNGPWEKQIGLMKNFFTSIEWWKLEPHDQLLSCATPRGRDRKHLNRVAPPETVYWCLAEPGRQYLLYARGLSEPLQLPLRTSSARLKARQWNPRTGEFTPLELEPNAERFSYRPPDGQDWVVLLDQH